MSDLEDFKVTNKGDQWYVVFTENDKPYSPLIPLTSVRDYTSAVKEGAKLFSNLKAGIRTIVPTELELEMGSYRCPVSWSVCGKCFTSVVNNGEKSQYFWARDWDALKTYMADAIIHLALDSEGQPGYCAQEEILGVDVPESFGAAFEDSGVQLSEILHSDIAEVSSDEEIGSATDNT